MNRVTLYGTTGLQKDTLLIGAVNEFDITEGRVYRMVEDQGAGTFPDCVWIINDKGVKQDCSVEYFYLYRGESVLNRF